jgi:mono/diheme cytochrome c family protein
MRACHQLRIGLLILFLAAANTYLAAQAMARPSSGATLFEANCSSCHGSDANGNTALGKALGAANLHGEDVQNLSDVALKKVIEDGRGNMPSFARHLSDEQLTQLVTYLREIGGAKSAGLGSGCPRCPQHRAGHRHCRSRVD